MYSFTFALTEAESRAVLISDDLELTNRAQQKIIINKIIFTPMYSNYPNKTTTKLSRTQLLTVVNTNYQKINKIIINKIITHNYEH